MRNFILTIISFLLYFHATAQAPSIQWQKSLGGSNTDGAYCIKQTSDGGYILTGESNSIDDQVTGNHGNQDYWVVKLNDTGAIQWQKSLGGSNFDRANAIQETFDGGYIVAGYSISSDGNVTGNHGNYDYWVVKLNDTGAIQWQKSLGGSGVDYAWAIQQTSDAGYIVAGYSTSNDGDVSGNHGFNDYWVVKLNDTGAIQWQKSLGGSSDDYAYSIQQTSDGGYIVSGGSSSNDGDVSGNHGNTDYWVVKINDTGAIQWQKSLGGSNIEQANAIQKTTDGGYIVTGESYSNDGDVSGNHGNGDYWVVKINDTGAIQWQKCLGGSLLDFGQSVQQTVDSGYIIAGISLSNDGDVSGNHGDRDYWVVKINDTGNIQWQKPLGGGGDDYAYSVQQISDGGYIVAGAITSNDGDITGNHGGFDCWVVKLTCGINAGTISGDSVVCFGSTIAITDTASGGTWTVSNGNATVSGGMVTGVALGMDTVIYAVTNTCGTAITTHIVTVNPCPDYSYPVTEKSIISIVPNPTTGTLFISGAVNTNIKVYNLLGQLIKEAANSDNISISDFPAGMYFVRVFDAEGALLKQEKIIKNP